MVLDEGQDFSGAGPQFSLRKVVIFFPVSLRKLKAELEGIYRQSKFGSIKGFVACSV